MRGASYHRPQTTGSYVLKGCGHTVTMYTMHTVKIHQYRVQIIYKPGPEIFIAVWLSRNNHIKGKDKPIYNMDVGVDAIQSSIDMPECVSMEEIWQPSSQDDHLQQLKKFIIAGCPNTKDELHINIRLYWPY